MTARDEFLATLATEREARRMRRCPRCHRPRGWLCRDFGRPCEPAPRKRHRSHAYREANRLYWLRKAGGA